MTRRVIAAAVFVLTVLSGCRESHAATVPAHALLTYSVTPGGVPIHYPAWMHAAVIAEVETAIDAAGVPAGWTVEVAIPYFVHPTKPERLLQGLTYPDLRHLVLGIRAVPCNGEPILPVLQHEVDHANHPEDPCYGHPPGDPDC